MSWSRGLLLAAALLGALVLGSWFLFGRGMRRTFEASPDALAGEELARPSPAPQASAAEPLPLPVLRVRVDAGVEVKLRGASTEGGCKGPEAALCPGQYDVRASAGNQLAFAVVRLRRGETRELDLALQTASSLELTVVDADQLPVDRATVVAQHPLTGFLLEGRTDSDGTVSIGPVTPGEWQVVAWRDGWSPAAATVTAGKSATLRLGTLGTVEGTLQPAATGARLELATPERVTVATTFTDGGLFRLGPVPAGRYQLSITDDGFEAREQTVTVPSAGLVFPVTTGATLKGDLYGPKRERLGGEIALSGPGRSRTVTAVNGAFEMHALAAGRWRLSSGEGVAFADVDGGISRVELVVPKFDGVIAGACALDGGHRLPAGVTVQATSEDGTRTASAPCDARGFTLGGLRRGYYTLEVEAREGSERWSAPVGPASTGTTDVKVTVPGVAWFALRLVDERGHPLEPIGARTREHFETRDVELDLAAPGHVPATRTATLERGRDTLLGDVTLATGVRLGGRVLDAVTKDPVPGATVTVGGIEHVTGADGTFTSLEAPEGDVEVRTAHPRYASDRRATQAPGDVNIELRRAARVTGALITVDGSLPDGVEVWAMSGSTTHVAEVNDGAFVTPHLTDGRWLLRVVPASERGAASGFDTLELDIKGEGDRAVSLVERAAGLSFEVLVADKLGAPTPSEVLLVPRPAQAPPNDEEFARLLRRPAAIADPMPAPARYRFSNVPPGGYTLLASARGRVWTVALPVVVQPGMGPIRVSYAQVPYLP